MSKLLKQLKTLRGQVRKYKDTLAYYEKLFNEDGVIDDQERSKLDRLNAAIQKIEDNVIQRQQKLKLGGKIVNKVNETTENIGDSLRKRDDIVDHSLVNQEENPTPRVDDQPSPNDNSSIQEGQDKYAAIAETPAVKEFLTGIHKSEGGYVDDPNDPGGKTKYGIAEKREWPAFAKMFGLDVNNPSLIKDITKQQVDEYYIKTRFEQNGLDKIKSTKVINAIFDQSILTPGIVKKNIKRALNALDSNNKFPVNNSEFTTAEIAAINASNANQLVEKFVVYQNEYYDGLVKKNPTKFGKYIKGWKNRTARLTGFKGGEQETKNTESNTESNSGNTFEVPSGWGLLRIAKEHGVTVEQLKEWNADKLKTYGNGEQGFNAGETIMIKGGSSSGGNVSDDGKTSEGEETELAEGGYIKPSWIREAEKHLGKKETARMVKDDPWVKMLFESLGAYDWAKTQTVRDANWCAAFVSYCFKQTGQSPLSGFDGMRAKTYAAKYGKEVSRPVYGALAIVKRGGAGHIGFVVGYNKKTKVITMLGGNQNNSVNIKKERRQVIAYKVPSSWNIPEQNYLD